MPNRQIDTDSSLYEQSTLPNGLRVITAELPYTRSAAVQFLVHVGARNEPEKISGISHFVEHMVFKGTDLMPNPVQISEAIEGVGGALNACTDHETTSYRALVPSSHLPVALKVLTDMLRRSRFDPDEIKKERAVIVEEISSTLDSPGEIADLLFDQMLWGTHPLGRDIAGTRSSVRAIKRPDLIAHTRNHYTPASIVISVAGNVTRHQVMRAVEQLWGDASALPETSRFNPPAPISENTRPSVKIYRKRTEQTNLIVGVPALSYTHPERYAQDILDALLGGGMSSRLFVELRENRGLAYSVSSFVKSYRDAGAFGVHAAVDNDRLAPTLEVITAELARICEEAVGDVELRKVKEYLKGHTILGLERSTAIANWGAWQELMLGHIETVDDIVNHIEAVTVEDVRILAQRLFGQGALHLAVVGPAKDEDKLLQHLQRHSA